MWKFRSVVIAASCMGAMVATTIGPVQATVITASFEATVATVFTGFIGGTPINPDTAHPLLGTIGTGSFTYDTDDVGLGEVMLGPGDVLMSLKIFGQQFHEFDDVDFPNVPVLKLVDGLPTELDFEMAELAIFGPNPIEIIEPGVLVIAVGPPGFGSLTETAPGSGEFTTTVGLLVAVAVPEPSTLAIFAFGLAGLGFMSRRRRRKAVSLL